MKIRNPDPFYLDKKIANLPLVVTQTINPIIFSSISPVCGGFGVCNALTSLVGQGKQGFSPRDLRDTRLTLSIHSGYR